MTDEKTISSIGNDSGPTPVAPDAFEIGDEFPPRFGGRWLLGERLTRRGTTGQAEVFRARREEDGWTVALKIIRSTDRTAHERFEIEVKALQRCEGCPNIVRIIDWGYEPWRGKRYAWLAMELVPDARGLIDYLRTRRHGADPISGREIVRMLRDLANGLHAAHNAGVIHRDIKPQNVLVGSDGVAKIADFGLATPVLCPTATVAGDPGKNAIVGTWQYMSPEHVADNPDNAIRASSDLYSFGVLAYEALSGDRPFTADPGALPVETARRIIRDQPPRPLEQREPRVGPDLAHIVHRCLAKPPADRYESAAAIAHDLDDALLGKPIRSKLASPGYAALHRIRTAMVRHRGILSVTMLVLAACLTLFVIYPMIMKRTYFWHEYRTLLHRLPIPPAAIPPLDDVRIVAFIDNLPNNDDAGSPLITDFVRGIRETDYEAIRAIPGLEATDPTVVGSARAALGMAIERIAAAGARVIVNDFHFSKPGEPSQNHALASGMRAAGEGGVPYIQSLPSWSTDPFAVARETGQPGIQPSIAELGGLSRYGGVSAFPNADFAWTIELAVKMPYAPWCPSTSLAALGAVHGVEPSVPVIPDRRKNELLILRPGFAPSTIEREAISVRVSAIYEEPSGDEALDIPAGTLIAAQFLSMPDDADIASITLSIDEVLTSDIESLRGLFMGKAVFIGSINPLGHDYHPHPGGRELPGLIGHAVSFAMMHANVPIVRYQTDRIGYIFLIAGAATGTGLALAIRRKIPLLICAAACALAFLIVCALSYMFLMLVIEPTNPIIAMILSLSLTALIILPWRLRNEFLAPNFT